MSIARTFLMLASTGLLLLSACDGGDAVDEEVGMEECHDNADNDRDGRFDCDDEGCAGWPWCSGGDGDGDADDDWPEPCDRIGDPRFTSAGHGVLGPEGGAVEQTDTQSGIAGVRVEVAPGAWDGCWHVGIDEVPDFDTPDFPAGFRPFGAESVRIGVGLLDATWDLEPAPEPLPVTIAFPMTRIQPGPNDVRCAFRYDEEQGLWKLVFPDSVDSDRLVVETTASDDQWSWGLIDLGEVDIDGDLRPALEEHLGADVMAELDAELEALVEDANEVARDNDWRFNCNLLHAFENLFRDTKGAAFIAVDDLQMGYGCGQCNPLTPRFQEERELYDAVAFAVEFSSLLAGAGAAVAAGVLCPLCSGVVISTTSEFGALAVATAINANLDEWMGLSCDFSCYDEHVDLTLQMGTWVFYAADFLLSLIIDVEVHYMSPPCPVEEEVEGDDDWECGDGVDNDGDGCIDCADEGCDGSPRYECTYEGNDPGECSDHIDNDGDDLFDCDDDGCEESPECA